MHVWVLWRYFKIVKLRTQFLDDNALMVEDEASILAWITAEQDKAEAKRAKKRPAQRFSAVRYASSNPMALSAKQLSLKSQSLP